MTGVFQRPPRTVLALIGVCILAAALYWVGSGAVLDALKRCSPVAIAAAAVAIVAATILGAWNVYRIAELRSTMTFMHFLPVFWRSWAIGITLPGQVADMLTTLWQLKGRSGDLNFVAGRLLADKAITLGLILGLASFVPAFVGKTSLLASVLMLAALGLGAGAALTLVAWYSRRPGFLANWRLGARILPVLAASNVPIRVAASNSAITVAKLMATGFAYWVVLSSIDTRTPGFLTTTAISQSAGLIAYLPISFNGLGTVEISAVAMFRALGLQSATVLSAYLILRAITLVTAWLPVVTLAWGKSIPVDQ